MLVTTLQETSQTVTEPMEREVPELGRAEQAYVCFGCVAFVTGVRALGKHVRYCKEHKIPRSAPFHRYVRSCAAIGRFQRVTSRPIFTCPHCAWYRSLEITAYSRHQATCARRAWRLRAMEIRKRNRLRQRRAGRSLGYWKFSKSQKGRESKTVEYYQAQVRRVNASFESLTLAYVARRSPKSDDFMDTVL